MSIPGARVICRTPEEAYEAGCADGAGDPPLTGEQVIHVARLLGRDQATGEAA